MPKTTKKTTKTSKSESKPAAEKSAKPASPGNILSCSCSGVKSASKAYSVQVGERKESGGWNGASGTDCTCGGRKYAAINIAFPGTVAPEMPALPMPAIDAASVIRPFAEVRRRFSEIMDEMDRALAF